ncbi:MAG: hypothetical protein Q9161_008201 [Pseudevernia consocians]
MADGNVMKNLKGFLPSRGRLVHAASAVQTSAPNTTAATQGSEPSLQSPITAAFQSSSNKDDQPWGLKMLHRGQEPIVDVVAVHGLDGHREGTWTDDHKILWLRDLLPSKLPNARIWTWGYDSRTHTGSHHDHLTIKKLYDHGRELVYELDGERRDDNSYQRPIIFIAHSLGGIVVKSALLHSDRVRQGHLEEERSIKLSTYGIIFMGTPHQGAQGVSVGEILRNLAKVRGNTNDSLLKHLEEHSELLQQQSSEFTSISQDFDIKFAYETLPTPIIGGAAKVIVPKWSAVVPGTLDAAEFGISQDHRRMTKFSNSEDQDFIKLSRVLVSMVQKAKFKIETNWQSEGRMKQGRQTYKVSFNIRGVPSVAKYVERHREMQSMEASLLPEDQNKQRRIFVLHGLGGIGKTQLSIAYARKHQKTYTAVFWLNGQSRASDEMLVTKMTMEEGLELLENRIGSAMTGNSQAAELVNRVGGLPLALAQAASYMRETGTSIIEYLQSYNSVWEDLMEDEARSGSCTREYGDRSVYTTWTISFEYVKRKNEDAANMLQVWSYLDNKDIWYDIFNNKNNLNLQCWSSPPEWFRRVVCNKLSFKRITKTLLDYSLIEARHDSDSYGVHPVVHEWCRKTMNADKRHERAFLAITSVASAVPNYGDRDYSTYQRRLLPHANQFFQELMTVLEENLESQQANELYAAFHNLGHLYSSSGISLGAEAEAMYRHAISGREKSLGSHDENTLASIEGLGSVYTRQGKYRDAEAIYQHVLAERTAQFGPDHYKTIQSTFNLASVYLKQDKQVEVEDLSQTLVKWHPNALDPANEKTRLMTLVVLGQLYFDQGKLAESESTILQALAVMREIHTPQEQLIYTVLGRVYLIQERLVEAEATFQRALKECEKVYGLAHELTLVVMEGLGLTFQRQGRLTEAEALYQSSLAGQVRALSLGHSLTLKTREALRICYEKQGKLAQAEALYLQELEFSKNIPDDEKDEYTLDTINDLGVLYQQQGKLTEAEMRFQQALAGSRTVLGLKHELTSRVLDNLRLCYEEQGKLAEAETLYLQELELSKNIPNDEKDESTLDLINELGVLYGKQGKLTEAEMRFQQVLAGSRTVLGLKHRSTLNALNNLRICYKKQGKLAEAEALAQEQST